MSQVKLNKTEQEATGKGWGGNVLTFLHTEQRQKKNSVQITMTVKYRSR